MRRLFIVLSLVVSISACAKRGQVQVSAPGVVMASAKGTVVEGSARYYGDPYHGRATANGETFDKNKLTAAHRTLPFNTWVRVQNQLNRKAVDVRIGVRGPFRAYGRLSASRPTRSVAIRRSSLLPPLAPELSFLSFCVEVCGTSEMPLGCSITVFQALRATIWAFS